MNNKQELKKQIHCLVKNTHDFMDDAVTPNKNEKRLACEFALCIVLDIIEWANYPEEMPKSYVLEKYRKLTACLKDMDFL